MENENKKETADEKKLPLILDPEEQIRKFGHGKLVLQKPIKDGENTITELSWDFGALSGAEFCDALDRDVRAANSFRLTNTQALYLFAAAAEKGTPGISAADIHTRMGMMDTQKAIQVATVFFSASNRVGNSRIYNE